MFVNMSVYQKIQEDIKEAMFSKNNTKRDVLRYVVSDIKNKTVNVGKEITDDVCIQVIQKLVKQHEDSIDQFQKANRTDLVAKEALELTYLKFYLPQMLSEAETKHYIEMYINNNKIETSKKNMGVIMKHLKTIKEIDMKNASKILNQILL